METCRGSWLGLVIVVLVFATACSDGDPLVASTTSTSALTSTSTTAAVTTTTLPPETTTTSTTPPTPRIVAGSLPFSSETVVSGQDGVVAITSSGEVSMLRDTPTAAAFAVGDAIIVAQNSGSDAGYQMPEGSVVILGPDGERFYEGLNGEQLILDTGFWILDSQENEERHSLSRWCRAW